MRSVDHRLGVVATVILALAAALPAATVAQAPFRAACDLLDDAAVSAVLGVEAKAQRQGTRTMCTYIGEGGASVGLIWLHPDAADMAIFSAQEGSEPITVGGAEGVTFPLGGYGRVVLTLADGGLLDVTASPPDTDLGRQVELATALAEAILGAGNVTAVPADRGEVEPLYVVTTLCDALSVEEVNAITGGSYTAPDGAEEESCFYPATDGAGGITTGLFGEDGTIDAGTYTSEELTVAGRPATWDPEGGLLDVDAGAGRRLHVNAATFDEVDPAVRDQLVAIAEAIIPNLTSAAPPTPPPGPGCDAPLEDLSRITGLEIEAAMPFDPLCFYVPAGGDTTSGVLVGVVPGDDPAAALEAAQFSTSVEPSPTELDGRPALSADAPEGAFLAVDLDGLPGGDGQVLLVAVGGLPAGMDQVAVAAEVVRFLISRM